MPGSLAHSQMSCAPSLDNSNGHGRRGSNGGGEHASGIHSERQQPSSLLRSMSFSLLSFGIDDEIGHNEETVTGNHGPNGSLTGQGGAPTGYSMKDGSVTTISNCDTDSATGEPEVSPVTAAGGGDMLSNSIHGLMNVGTNMGTLLNPLNPFSTSQ